MPNSIEFYKGIFLHVILVRIIVPCSHLTTSFLCVCRKYNDANVIVIRNRASNNAIHDHQCSKISLEEELLTV